MKHKISVSVDENTIIKIREAVRGKRFRNRSHLIEYAVQKLVEEVER